MVFCNQIDSLKLTVSILKIISQPNLNDHQKQQALQLWNSEYPAKLQKADVNALDDFLEPLGDKTHFLLIENEEILGWACTFLRDNARWFFIMLSATTRGRGYGTTLLNELKLHETELSGWVIDHNTDLKANGELYASPLNSHLKNNFQVNDKVRLETEAMSAVKICWNRD